VVQWPVLDFITFFQNLKCPFSGAAEPHVTGHDFFQFFVKMLKNSLKLENRSYNANILFCQYKGVVVKLASKFIVVHNIVLADWFYYEAEG